MMEDVGSDGTMKGWCCNIPADEIYVAGITNVVCTRDFGILSNPNPSFYNLMSETSTPIILVN